MVCTKGYKLNQGYRANLYKGLLGGSWEALGSLLGGSWEALRRLLGGSWEALGRLLEFLGAFWVSYGSSGMLPGSHVDDLGGCWTHLGASWSALGPSSKGLGSLLGASEEHFGAVWG